MTVICLIKESDKSFWQQIYSTVAEDKVLLRYFSPLPLTSYHMTAINLYTQAQEGSNDWHQFLVEHRSFFQEMAKSLKQLQLKPELTIEKIVVSDVIQLHGHLPPLQREAIIALARQYHLEHKIPRVFHITLAYRYQNPPDDLLESMTRNVSDQLQKLVQRHTCTWSLNEAGLYYFDDMTAFIPWEDNQ